MKKVSLICALFSLLLVVACSVQIEDKAVEVSSDIKNQEIVRFDRPDASILKGVKIPTDKLYFYTSGLVADLINPNAPVGKYERYGDTYQQSISILKKIQVTLKEGGFDLEDVFFLRVYLAPNKEGIVDWDAWFKAYGEYFNNEDNPNKVARSTIAVYALANPDLLIEIEAVAAK